MKMSMLIVTKDRGDFGDWLGWNLTKQTRAPDEVIVVDSSSSERHRGKVFEALDQAYAKIGGPQPTLREIVKPPETTTGAARQIAMDEATGDILAWMDDDDWHHPRRLEQCAAEIEKGAKVAYVSTRWRLYLHRLTVVNIQEAGDHIYIPFSVYEAQLAKSIPFRDIAVGEDHWWFFDEEVGLCSKLPKPWWMNEFVAHVHIADVDAIVNIHGRNTWNTGELAAYQFYKRFFSSSFPEAAPMGISAEEWEETWHQVMALRRRLYADLEGTGI